MYNLKDYRVVRIRSHQEVDFPVGRNNSTLSKFKQQITG